SASEDRGTRPAGGAKLHGKRCLENLFQQFALVNVYGRTDTQAASALHQDDLIGILGGEIQLVRHDDNGVTICRGEAAKSVEQTDLRGDIEMESGLIKQQKQRLLSQSSGENDPLLFAAGDLIHPAIAEISGANLG